MQKIPLANGVEKVYISELMALFIGTTNTAIHAYAAPFGSSKCPVKDSMLIMMTGNQQRKSVRMINIILVAMVEFCFIRVEHTALLALVTVRYIKR